MEGLLVKITNIKEVSSVERWATFLGTASSNKDEFRYILITTKDGNEVDQVMIENNASWEMVERNSQLYKDVTDYIVFCPVTIGGKKTTEVAIKNFIF